MATSNSNALAKNKNKTEMVKIDEEDRTTEELELFKKKTIEDERMATIFRMGQNLTEKFDNRAYLHPHGMTDFDYKSIPDYRRDSFETFKHRVRHENYKYLGDHPEIDGLLALFFKKLLKIQPEDPVHFAAEYFTRDTTDGNYMELVAQERERLARYRVIKMKAAEKINTIPVYDKHEKKEVVATTCKGVKVDPCSKPRTPLAQDPNAFADYDESPEALLNWLKKLNIGPLAQDANTIPKALPIVEIKSVPKKKKKKYCGCKDPGRREMAHPLKQVKTDIKIIPTEGPDTHPDIEPDEAEWNDDLAEVSASDIDFDQEDEDAEFDE